MQPGGALGHVRMRIVRSTDMNLNPIWSVPEFEPRLNKNEVHVWRASTDVSPSLQAILASSLDGEEARRARQFFLKRDRNRFMTGRGILRKILGGYLQRSPEELRFTLGSHGKPALPGEPGRLDVRFNLSHSDGLALFAVALEREVGIDVEKIHPGVANEAMEASTFTGQEQAEFYSTRPEERDREFFQRWTCKEAYIKARGGGLQIPLKSFEVSLVPGELPRLRHLHSDLWDLVSFFASSGFVAALVVEGSNVRLRFWDWS